SYVTLALAQSESQQAELDQLLADQQTPGSPNYHRWLKPEDFAQRFGVSEDDLSKIRTWLEGQGLTIAAAARGRNWIAVNGTAAQLESALQTEIHTYLVNGETHFANASDPSVPAAFAGIVRSIRGLTDFRAKPAKRPSPNLVPNYTSQSSGKHYLAPDDLATIYNMTSLYKAGMDGSGQSVVIAGQTRIFLSDIQLFRSSYNLPAIDPQIIQVPNSRDPGVSSVDLPEADLDIEWAGAVARNANIIYVFSNDVMEAVQYAIDQNLAPVVSTSYGLCEIETPVSDALTLRSWAKQGNAQGITWFSASGDSGAADCDDPQNTGYSVDAPASIPEVTGVGGTEFQEGSGTFWNEANDANRASVLSYIPEAAWNDSVLDGRPSATGGGASAFFAQPSWQTGPGVPGDNARHVPDISMSASNNHDAYLVYTSTVSKAGVLQVPGVLQAYGGTSVPTPAFAGVAALLNQYLVSSGAQSSPGLGNMNPKLYSLAQSSPDIFHDIVSGDNIVTVNCTGRNKNCGAMPVGFSAGAGYDSVTGLGSVDTYKLVTGWNGAGGGGPTAKASIKLLSNLNTLSPTDVVYLIATATNPSGVTPSGSVQFQANGASLGSANLVGSAGTATATLSVTGSQLPQGSPVITAVYTDGSANSLSAS
ncbi:MAG TPA: protease pro-enzyme activation domain-containing protein, partial [Bryobacteraceae bacterium]